MKIIGISFVGGFLVGLFIGAFLVACLKVGHDDD